MPAKGRRRLPAGDLPMDWTPDELARVRRWLSYKMQHLANGREKMKAALKIAELESFRENFTYFTNALAAVRWLDAGLERVQKAQARRAEPSGPAA